MINTFTFTKGLQLRLIKYFEKNYIIEITCEEANEFLKSLSRLNEALTIRSSIYPLP
jgi:hypothetical protein